MTKISTAQLEHFAAEGYLVVRDLLDVERVIDPIIKEYHAVLDRLADDLHASGEISSTYKELPFGERLTQICEESGRVHAQYFDFRCRRATCSPTRHFGRDPRCLTRLRPKTY
jgi:hypothetical protein